MKIEIEVRTVYGLAKAYPVNQAAHDLADLVGTKTLSPQVLQQAGKLGLEVVEVNAPKLAQVMA